MKKRILDYLSERAHRRRIQHDAGVIGSMAWAEYLGGWFDEVSAFAAVAGGKLHFKELGVTLPDERARILLGRNRSYDQCLALKKEGVSFEASDIGILARHGEVTVRICSPVELFLLWELVCRNTYRYALPAGERLVFDIGMNVGIASLVMAARDRDAVLHGFEPFPETLDRLKINLSLNPGLAARIVAHPVALADRDAREQWHMGTENVATSGQFSESVEGGSKDTWVDVRKASSAMSEVLAAHPASFCVVKMDCEGGEYAILRDWTGSGLAGRIDVLLMEYHEMGGHSVAEVEAWLGDNQFASFVSGPSVVNPSMRVGAIQATRIARR